MKRVAIIGSGSWGTALGIYLVTHGHNVKMWSYDKEEMRSINEDRKCILLPNVVIPEGLTCTSSFEEALDGAEIVLHVTPSNFVRSTLRGYKQYIKENQIVLMCSKGFESETGLTLDEVMKEELPGIKIGILSGPSHAEEVSLNIATALVVASKHEDVREIVSDEFKSDSMRMYTSEDVKGVELGGALKNIIAFCSGILDGLNQGDNTYAALLTRGLVEISRLGVALGGQEKTFYGLTGLGDLIVTCGSVHSRNRKAGELVGKGLSIEEVRKEIGMTIESIDNIEVAYKLAKKYNIEMPITEKVYEVLYEGLTPNEAINILMTRDQKSE